MRATQVLGTLMLLAACGGSVDGNDACDRLSRDQCLKTAGCFLAYGGQPDSYTCRAPANDCERATNSGGQAACEGLAGCTWMPGSCYCPEGQNCLCGGGPPQSCRQQ